MSRGRPEQTAPPRRPAVDCGDLLRVFAALPQAEDRAACARWLGFGTVAHQAPPEYTPRQEPVPPRPTDDAPSVASEPADEGMVFWRQVAVTEGEALPSSEPDRGGEGLTADDLDAPGRGLFKVPATPALARWSTLHQPLLDTFHRVRASQQPEVSSVVKRWSQGERLDRLPRAPRKVWGDTDEFQLWVDRSARLIPYWDDQDALVRRLRGLCGGGLSVAYLTDGVSSDDALARHRSRPRTVLVLGDLGFYGSAVDRGRWLEAALDLRRAGVKPAALVPCPPPRWQPAVAAAWCARPWEGRRRRAAARPGRAPGREVEALLRLVAMTALTPPGLLRALRQLLPAEQADSATEADVWLHPDVAYADLEGLVLAPEAARHWRARFARPLDEVPPGEQAQVRALRRQVRELIKTWHASLPPEVGHTTTLLWSASQAGDVDTEEPQEVADAWAFVRRLAASLRSKSGDDRPRAAPIARQVLEPLTDAEVESREELRRLRDALDGGGDGPPPDVTRHWIVGQRGASLVVSAREQAGWPGGHAEASPLAMLASSTPSLRLAAGALVKQVRHGSVEIVALPGRAQVEVRTDRVGVTIAAWEREPWAVEAGRDRYGLWAAFAVGKVEHRLRWIPPGQFLMGSPGSEAGRFDDEGPQHLVTLTKGYWLGETPVTQALWKAVMGNNPSRFVSDDRPVENVSWGDCEAFLQRANSRLTSAVTRAGIFDPAIFDPAIFDTGSEGAAVATAGQGGLLLRLPTEAEWERACRAGTTTATWAGDLVIEGDNHAKLLDRIAWYGGNSGVGFELDNGEDSSNWSDKQYPHTLAGTHPVGSHDDQPREANPFGLRDMLGNVWEWCQDWRGDYLDGPVTDPRGPAHGSLRVSRGGAWSSYARFVRAAYRNAYLPGIRTAYLGFRLAGGLSAPSQQAGEPRSGEAGRGAGRDPDPAAARDATPPRGGSADPSDPRGGRRGGR